MKAMILAAGKGTRMRDLSDRLPKPLVPVAGKPLIDRAFDHLDAAGVGPVVVNVHHLADRMEAHLMHRTISRQAFVSDERKQLLETGGGVKKAMPYLCDGPFFVINGDALWTNGRENALKRMQDAFRPGQMDVLLLLVPTHKALGYDGPGDIALVKGGSGAVPVRMRGLDLSAPYMFGGILIVKPSLYDDMPQGAFSNREIFKKAAMSQRLFGLVHDGEWMHVGTPEAIKEAEMRLAALGGD